MKKLIVALMLLGATQAFAQNNLAEAYDVDGWVVYVKSTPKNPHRNLGDIKAKAFFTTLKEDFLIAKMVKTAKKEYPEGEALIFTGNLAYAEVITFNMSKKRASRPKRGEAVEIDPAKKLAEVEEFEGKLVFIKNKPKAPFEELSQIELEDKNENNKVNYLIKETLKKATAKHGNNFDAIVFINGSNMFKAKVIKFK